MRRSPLHGVECAASSALRSCLLSGGGFCFDAASFLTSAAACGCLFDIPGGATEFPAVQQSSPGTVTLASLVGSPLSSHVPPRYVTHSTPVPSLPRDSDPNRSVPCASAGQVPTRSSEAGTTSSILLPHPTTASDSVLPPMGSPPQMKLRSAVLFTFVLFMMQLMLSQLLLLFLICLLMSHSLLM